MSSLQDIANNGAKSGGFNGEGLADNWQDGWSLQESDGSVGNLGSVGSGGEISLTASGGTTKNAKHPRQEIHQKGDQQWTKSDKVNAMSATFDKNQTDDGVISQLFATGKGPTVQVIKTGDKVQVKFFENAGVKKNTKTVELPLSGDEINVGIAVQGDQAVVSVNGQTAEGDIGDYDANQKFSFKAGIYGKEGSKATIKDLDLIRNGSATNMQGGDSIDWQSDQENPDTGISTAYDGALTFNETTGALEYNGKSVERVQGTNYFIASDGTIYDPATGSVVGSGSKISLGGEEYTVSPSNGLATNSAGNIYLNDGVQQRGDGTIVSNGQNVDPYTGQPLS